MKKIKIKKNNSISKLKIINKSLSVQKYKKKQKNLMPLNI